MPDIASVLREEVSRLSRKEGRAQFGPALKAAAQHRRDIAALKRQVEALERRVRQLSSQVARTQPSSPAQGEPGANLRFVAKGLRSHRARLGLSAGDFGRLVGVSAQSIYAWETGKTVPRRGQIARIAQVRALGKREAAQRLEEAPPQRPAKAASRKRG